MNSRTNQSSFTTDPRTYQSSYIKVPENHIDIETNSRTSQSSDTMEVREEKRMNSRTNQCSLTTDPRTYQSSYIMVPENQLNIETNSRTSQSIDTMDTMEPESQMKNELNNKTYQSSVEINTNIDLNNQVIKDKNSKNYQRSKKTEQTNRIHYQPFKKNNINYNTPKNKRPIRPIKLFRKIQDKHLTYKERNIKFKKKNEDIEDMNLQVILMNTQTITASKFQEMVEACLQGKDHSSIFC